MNKKKNKKTKRKLKPDLINIQTKNLPSEAQITKIQKIFGQELQIKTTIVPEMIGGIKIIKNSEIFDGSITEQLNKLRNTLYNIQVE